MGDDTVTIEELKTTVHVATEARVRATINHNEAETRLKQATVDEDVLLRAVYDAHQVEAMAQDALDAAIVEKVSA